MDNVTIVVNELDGTEHIVIDRGNGEFTSMTKAHYEELQKQAEQSTPIVEVE
jgi:hypothetical protein